MAYINYYGNIHAIGVVSSSPEYRESVGEYKREMTRCLVKCKERTPEGVQTVNINLLFFSAMAIPAMKIPIGMCIEFMGNESVEERFSKGKTILERTVFCEKWEPRLTDPLGYMEELKVRREVGALETEFRRMFAEMLTEAKSAIMEWVKDWFKNNIETVRSWFKREQPNK